MSRHALPGHRRAFTLIEVLVVVGIIALLVAILTPGLSLARRYSQSAACLSNLRSIGVAMYAYSQYNKGWLPAGPADQLMYVNIHADASAPETSTEPREGGGWRPVMHTPWQWGGRRASWQYLVDKEENPVPETLPRPLTRQVYPTAGLDGRTPVFDCPADDGLEYWDTVHVGDWARQGLGRRALHNLVGNSYYVHLRKSSQSSDIVAQRGRKHPGQTVLTYEGNLYYGYFTPKNPFIPEVPEAVRKRGWHSNDRGFNFLFLDGHAEHRRLKLVDGTVTTGQAIIFAEYPLIVDYYR